MENPALFHDIEEAELTGGQIAMNCWIGAALYVLCLAFSIFSVFMNKRAAKNAELNAPSEDDE